MPEILKFSVAPETHFKSILMFGGGGGKFIVFGLDPFASEPFNYYLCCHSAMYETKILLTLNKYA